MSIFFFCRKKIQEKKKRRLHWRGKQEEKQASLQCVLCHCFTEAAEKSIFDSQEDEDINYFVLVVCLYMCLTFACVTHSLICLLVQNRCMTRN